MKHSFLLLLIMLSMGFISCRQNTQKVSSVFTNDKFNEQEFTDELKAALEAFRSDSSNIHNELKELYTENEYKPLWVNAEGNATLAEHFLKDLENIKLDGIDPARYYLSDLRDQLKAFTTGEVSVGKVISLDTFITYNYLKASRDLLLGIVSPKSVDSLWFHSNDSVRKLNHVTDAIKNKTYPSLDSFRSKLKLYTVLKNSLKHYQKLTTDDSLKKLKTTLSPDSSSSVIVESIISIETPWLTTVSDTLSGTPARIQAYQQYLGIKRTGKLDSITISYLKRDPDEVVKLIAVNMERVRWLPTSFEKEHIVVNIPTMNFSMQRDGSEVMKMNVVVGKSSRQTPSLNAMMSNIVINPPWGVPPTILKNDVLPGVLKTGSGYLRKKGLEAFDHKGRRIDASTITAANYKRYTFRQPPGHSNALGYVKFNFPNKWDIYMHDTPHREDFEKFDRSKSSGCIRVQHPKDLANYILSQMEGKIFDRDKLDSIITTRRTTSENLKHKIPVHIIYLTAWIDDGEGNVRFARDFYKKDAKLMAAISK